MDIARGTGEVFEKSKDIINRNMDFDPDKRIEWIGEGTKVSEENSYSPDDRVEVKEEKPVREIKTINGHLKDKEHPDTKIPFKEKLIDLGNEIVKGVFPEFPHEFQAEIPREMYKESDFKQFKECNKQLLAEIEKNPELKSKFSEEQIEQIKEGTVDGSAPDGYVWHHSEDTGKIQLVDFEIHAITRHTGGRYVWGGGSENR